MEPVGLSNRLRKGNSPNAVAEGNAGHPGRNAANGWFLTKPSELDHFRPTIGAFPNNRFPATHLELQRPFGRLSLVENSMAMAERASGSS